jgi:N-acetylmuramoyl-L-alanine amidase
MTLPLAMGATGEAVRDLQLRLARVGFEPEPPAHDPIGHFGEGTASALQRFQEGRGLRPDGVCGPETWHALVEAGYRLGDRLLYERRPMLRGDDVAELQTRLGRLGFHDERVDGILGPQTAAALVDFQRNTGLTSDGICGPECVAALRRLDRGSEQPVKGRVVERLRLAGTPRQLAGRRVMVGDRGGVAALATAVERSLTDAGATVISCHHPDGSARAEEANRFGADVYVELTLATSPACSVAFYSTPGYESAGGRRLAERLAEAASTAVAPEVEATLRGMRLPVLRETRMPAVVVELGPPSTVVERTAQIATEVSRALAAWTVDPIEG